MAKHKQEDPWAGFVDVLSSILMVVIFLVVILGVSIFAISQQVTKVAVEEAKKEEREKQAQSPVTPPAPSPQPAQPSPEDLVVMLKKEAAKPVEVERPDDKQSAQSPDKSPTPLESRPDEKRGAEGSLELSYALRARESDDAEGKSNLTVRSVMATPTRNIEVASEEVQKTEDAKAEIVKTSHAIFALKFKTGSYRIDPSSAQEMCKHMDEDMLRSPLTLEIRSIARTRSDSVSDSRRVAYYRGMQTRSELIKCGIAETRIAVKLREAGQGEDGDNVQVFVKP